MLTFQFFIIKIYFSAQIDALTEEPTRSQILREIITSKPGLETAVSHI